jgi:hypothetical protein
MGVAKPFAHGFTDQGRLSRSYPDHGVRARDVGELELIYARFGGFGLLVGGIIERRHVLGPADAFEPGVFIGDA